MPDMRALAVGSEAQQRAGAAKDTEWRRGAGLDADGGFEDDDYCAAAMRGAPQAMEDAPPCRRCGDERREDDGYSGSDESDEELDLGDDEDQLAVVDRALRVRGVQGLRAADASVMPVIVGANTNATCVALGERAAEILESEYAGEHG